MGKSISEAELKEINIGVEELVEEIKDIKLPNQPIGEVKKSDIKSKLFRIEKNVLKVLPKTAEMIALFTPLSPFSKLIGEGTKYLFEAIEKEFYLLIKVMKNTILRKLSVHIHFSKHETVTNNIHRIVFNFKLKDIKSEG